MPNEDSICLPLPRECCGFIDENEAFDVQFIGDGRLICYSYGKEAFNTFWIIVDSFYGTKKIVITEVNKIDDSVLLLSMDSYLLRTFDGDHSIQIVELDGSEQGCKTRNLVQKTRGVVQRISVHEDLVIIVLSVYETRFDELVKSTEFLIYKIGEWDVHEKKITLKDEHFNHVDFVGSSSTGNLCFFASEGRIFHISDFDTLIEVDVGKSEVLRHQTDGLSSIFGTNMEHLAKNTNGSWCKDHFYLYTTPNPAVVKLEHYFACLSLETNEWSRIYLNGPQFIDIIEIHMTVNREGVMVLDIRSAFDERNIHRVPLSQPQPLLHLSQFSVNRKHGNLVEMSEEDRASKNFPIRLPIQPAFTHEDITKYTLSKKEFKLVVSDAPYG